MADILPTLLGFPPDEKKLTHKQYDSQANTYLRELSKISSSAWSKTVDKKGLLELLDPTTNSIAYLVTLNRQIEATSNKNTERLEHLFALAQVFLTTCDPVQIRYVGEEWRTLFEFVCKGIEGSQSTDCGALVGGLLRLDPTAGTFTPNHLRVLRLCIRARVPSQALPILDNDIYAYPSKAVKNLPEDYLSEAHELSNPYITEKSGFSIKILPEYVLEYYLLGAHVYIGLRNFNRTRLFLETVILSPSPAKACSGLQVEAYKKWVLIGLLSEGKGFPLPKTADAAVMKSIRNLAKPYEALADDFDKRDYKKFIAEADAGEVVWSEDGNQRLIKEVADALMRYRVTDLQKTYAALPVTRVADQIGLSANDTMQLLQSMIQMGYLKASISSGSDAVLCFHSTDTSSTSIAAKDLEDQTERIQNLVTFIRDADRRLQLSKEYVEHQKRMKKAGGPDGDIADAMDLSWDPPVSLDDGDEDIMGA
ncbi:hypothetical protein M409DRAFT_62123 [Zasmidium cellare ATCC 36951]|uniref:COP9 signalosome complex subunit 3 n=1 Tax=Zasmidium cellare ATCC 36951 TaxID=1080233 RepID=A0A6A6D4B6_ZASCE|nr:uncharacterized protein M409DRAFT_62123 [Zasmidium cellare ATCC 36951]KAF2173895.1 hypothetical protein M409DRAFT_62123 [Zasmidium cellare ATCC 36951]